MKHWLAAEERRWSLGLVIGERCEGFSAWRLCDLNEGHFEQEKAGGGLC